MMEESRNGKKGGSNVDVKLRPFADADLPTLAAWLAQPHVSPWFTPAEDWLNEVRGRRGRYAFIRHRIVLADGQAVGFCQYYPFAAGGEHWQGDLPLAGTYSMDYLIGDPRYLRRGLGAQAVRLLGAEIFSAPEARRVIVRPEAENAASRRTLQAAGFAYDERNALFILMREDFEPQIARPGSGVL